jgi:hypothetical protein
MWRKWIKNTSLRLPTTLGLSLCLVGCTTIKKATVVATGAALGATAGTVLSGGVLAPIAGAMTSAFVVDVVTEISHKTTGGNMDCAPDNFWSLLGSLIQMGGWALILIVVAPMVLGWILPGPLERKKKS